jgi:hypothetical protein
MTGTRMWPALRAMATAATLLAVCCVTPSAQAVPPQSFEDTTTEVFEDCGIPLEATTTSSGRLSTRPAPNDPAGLTFLIHQRSQYRTVITNPATGQWVVESGHSTFKELRATHVQGNVYTFTAQETGAPYLLATSKGRVLLRDRGVIRFEATFDVVGGRHAYSNTGPAEGHVVVHLAGPHPSMGADFCALVLPHLT